MSGLRLNFGLFVLVFFGRFVRKGRFLEFIFIFIVFEFLGEEFENREFNKIEFSFYRFFVKKCWRMIILV